MNRLSKSALVLIVTTLISFVARAEESGGPDPLVTDLAGPEIWIDGPDSVRSRKDVRHSDVAVANDGTRVHVWTAFDPFDRDDVFLRRFDAMGNPLEDPRLVNSTTENDQRYPRVAVAADGSFLVIFQSSETPSGQGFDQYMVRSQAYDADGNAVGAEQLVSTVPTSELVDTHADVAPLRAAGGSPGGYVVVWRNSQISGSTNGTIRGALISAAGVPGAESQLSPNAAGQWLWPSVAELKDGGFVVVWILNSAQKVQGRRFNAAAGPMGSVFDITPVAAPGGDTEAAIGWDGNVLVVWEDGRVENPPLQGGSNAEIWGQVLDEGLGLSGSNFRINNVFAGIQDDPRIADLGPWGFLVVWNSDTASAGSDTTQSIEARVVSGPGAFDANGDGSNDPQVQFNVWDNNAGQNLPGSQGWYGQTATSWQSNTWDGEPEPDTVNQLFEIGRNLDACLFCDDFEWYSPGDTGNLWRWTLAFP